jgi:hypothetical protein
VVEEVPTRGGLLEDLGVARITAQVWLPAHFGDLSGGILLLQERLPEFFGVIVTASDAAGHSDHSNLLGEVLSSVSVVD